MIEYVLVIIILAEPTYQGGGYASSVVVPGFTTEQACKNAAAAIKVPEISSARVSQSYSKQCVAKSL